MFRNMRLRKRFTLIMLIVYFCSLPFLIIGSYYILKRNAVKEALQEANIMLAAWEGAGIYTTEILRPNLARFGIHTLIPEAAKGLFIAKEIENVTKEYVGDYSYRVAALNPLNPEHIPDKFEEELIKNFREGRIQGEWRGLRTTTKGEYYVVVRPQGVSTECLMCHGDPQFAPEAIKARYGTSSGYNWKAGEINSIRSVYVPVDIPISNAKRALITFTIIYSIFFFLVIIIIDRLIIANIIKPIESFVKIAEDVSRGNFEKEFDVRTNDEMKTLADAFTRMKLSLMKAIDIMKKR